MLVVNTGVYFDFISLQVFDFLFKFLLLFLELVVKFHKVLLYLLSELHSFFFHLDSLFLYLREAFLHALQVSLTPSQFLFRKLLGIASHRADLLVI